MAEGGSFVWNELVTQDQVASGEFYSRVFGWDRKETDAGPLGTYTIFQKDGHDVAGMMNPTIDYTRKLGPRWFAYVAVDDVDACVARAEELRARIIAGPEDIPGTGRVCFFEDPLGAPIRVMQRREP